MLLVPVVLAAIGGLAQLDYPIWYDEAWTLGQYADAGPLKPFTDYSAPNNHILFSSMLSLWKHLGFAQQVLRILPTGMFVVATVLLVATCKKLAGTAAAVFGGTAFACGLVTLNFATQLRGYGPSWVFVAGGFCILSELYPPDGRPSKRTGPLLILYVLCAAAAVATVPTNVIPFAALACWAGCMRLSQRRPLARPDVVNWGIVALAPAAGVVAYLGVLDQAIHSAGQNWSGASRWATLGHWFASTVLWQAPLWCAAAVGLLVPVGKKTPVKNRSVDRRTVLCLLMVSAVVPVVAVLVMPSRPVARILVPMLPLWLGGAGLCAARLPCVAACSTRRAVYAGVLCAVLVAVGVVRIVVVRFFRWWSTEPKPQDLVIQYYHRPTFDPAGFVAALSVQARHRPVVVMLDGSDHVAVVYYAHLTGAPDALTLAVLDEPGLPPPALGRLMLSSGSEAGLVTMVERLGLSPGAVESSRPAIDTGFYKGWWVRRPVERPRARFDVTVPDG